MTDLEMDLMLANARIKQLERELADKKPTVKEAIAVIKEHCMQHPACEGCHLLGNDETCFFAKSDLPDEWAFGGDINGY